MLRKSKILRCPKCNSRRVKLKTYTEELAYMGIWLHCKRCGVGTQIIAPKKPKSKVDEGPFPLGELFTKEDRDFHEYKRGFKF